MIYDIHPARGFIDRESCSLLGHVCRQTERSAGGRRQALWGKYTGPEIDLSNRFGEICYCSAQTCLGSAYHILQTFISGPVHLLVVEFETIKDQNW